jgi:hypothetical protein
MYAAFRNPVHTAIVCAWTILAIPAAVASVQKPPLNSSQQEQFINYSSCPATGQRSGNCPGYRVGYKVGLCAGGQDRWTNMVWLTEAAYREQQRREAAACARQGANPSQQR